MYFFVCHFGACSIPFCLIFYVTKFQCLISIFGSYIPYLCCGYQHNKVFQKLLKLMNQRPVINLHWGLEGAELWLIRHPWRNWRRILTNRENCVVTGLCSSPLA